MLFSYTSPSSKSISTTISTQTILIISLSITLFLTLTILLTIFLLRRRHKRHQSTATKHLSTRLRVSRWYYDLERAASRSSTSSATSSFWGGSLRTYDSKSSLFEKSRYDANSITAEKMGMGQEEWNEKLATVGAGVEVPTRPLSPKAVHTRNNSVATVMSGNGVGIRHPSGFPYPPNPYPHPGTVWTPSHSRQHSTAPLIARTESSKVSTPEPPTNDIPEITVTSSSSSSSSTPEPATNYPCIEKFLIPPAPSTSRPRPDSQISIFDDLADSTSSDNQTTESDLASLNREIISGSTQPVFPVRVESYYAQVPIVFDSESDRERGSMTSYETASATSRTESEVGSEDSFSSWEFRGRSASTVAGGLGVAR